MPCRSVFGVYLCPTCQFLRSLYALEVIFVSIYALEVKFLGPSMPYRGICGVTLCPTSQFFPGPLCPTGGFLGSVHALQVNLRSVYALHLILGSVCA